MKSARLPRHYTYIYHDGAGVPYYVGKGRGSRVFREHGDIPVPPRDQITIIPCRTEAVALEREEQLIARYGFLVDGGTLLNTRPKGWPALVEGFADGESLLGEMSGELAPLPRLAPVPSRHVAECLQYLKERWGIRNK